jgi:hypothetical protein
MSHVELPPMKVPYSRSLLNEVKLGKGKSLKLLRDELATRPDIRDRFIEARKIDHANEKQKERLQWAKNANSRVRRVDTSFRDKCTFTNPAGTRELPDRGVIKKAELRACSKVFHA